MNRVILDESQNHTKRQGDLFTLSNPEVCTHLKEHIEIKEGQTLKVTLLNEGLAKATVTEISENQIKLKVTDKINVDRPRTILLIGASRPPTVKKILEHGTSFGIREYIFFQAELSEKSYLTSKVFEEDKTYDLLTKGLSQGATYAHLPKVTRVQKLSEAVELIKEYSQQNFLLSLEAKSSFLGSDINLTSEHCLALGPERGWTKSEESFLKEYGFTPIKVGETTLRVEMATFSALGQLAMIGLNR